MDIKETYANIKFQILSWYLDEGDYQPTEEEADKKSLELLVLSKEKWKAELIEKIEGMRQLQSNDNALNHNETLDDIKDLVTNT